MHLLKTPLLKLCRGEWEREGGERGKVGYRLTGEKGGHRRQFSMQNCSTSKKTNCKTVI